MLNIEQANAVVLKLDVILCSSLTKEEMALLLHAKEVVSEVAYRAKSDFLNHESSKKYLKMVEEVYHYKDKPNKVITIQEFHDS